MKRALTVVLIVLTLGNSMAPAIMAGEKHKLSKAVSKWATTQTSKVAEEDVQGNHRSLSLREARRMGITLRGVAQSVKKLQDEGRISEDSTEAQISALVANDIFENNKAAWGDPAAIDWQAILDFIEALLPIIMKIIDLFTVNTAIMPPTAMILPAHSSFTLSV